MSNFFEIILGQALQKIVLNIDKNVKKEQRVREEEQKYKKLKDGSINVEFKVKENELLKNKLLENKLPENKHIKKDE